MIQYQVSFGEAISRGFNKYCCFTGRASRSEFWWWQLFTFIVGIPFGYFQVAAMMSDGEPSTFINILNYIVSLALLLPGLGLDWRRLHDTGRSGWNICWNFLPLIGQIILLVFWCQPSQEGDNKYGPEPNMID